jgi:Reverse transcriptase (RNA-dependent DNA polymerase)
MVLEKIIRDAKLNRVGDITYKSHQIMAYADDVAIIASNSKELQDVTKKIVEAAFKMGLKVNQDKCKIMRLGESRLDNTFRVNTSLGEMAFEVVNEFVYLGARITYKCEEEREVDARIIKGNKSMGALNNLLKSKYLSRRAKFRLYDSVLRPTATFGCETWTMNKRTQENVMRWERKVLRRILGGKKLEDGFYVRRTNREIYDLYAKPTIDMYIKARRLQWLGHIERMEDDRIPRRIAWKTPMHKRKKGRPRKRWREEVMADLREKGIQNWKAKAKNRKEWKRITKLWA